MPGRLPLHVNNTKTTSHLRTWHATSSSTYSPSFSSRRWGCPTLPRNHVVCVVELVTRATGAYASEERLGDHTSTALGSPSAKTTPVALSNSRLTHNERPTRQVVNESISKHSSLSSLLLQEKAAACDRLGRRCAGRCTLWRVCSGHQLRSSIFVGVLCRPAPCNRRPPKPELKRPPIREYVRLGMRASSPCRRTRMTARMRMASTTQRRHRPQCQ